jgi:putative thioredoxin
MAGMRQDGDMQQPRDFSLYGAVDLGARQAAAQRSQQAAARPSGPAGSPGANVFDVTEETFNVDVVERSRSVPVIMDLWAEWCGPCKQLSPILEKLAGEAAGAWVLAKVDVDANQQLAAALQVQSIPTVVAVIGGQLANGFQGALPEAQVREWIGQVMQGAEQLGLPPAGAESAGGESPDGQPAAAPGPDGPGMRGGPGAGMMADPAFEEAQQAMERGDLDAAAAAFQRVLATSPGHPVATLGLAQLDLIRRVGSYDEGQARRAAAENPADVEAQSQVADIEVATGRPEEGFDRLLGTISRTSGDDRNRAGVHLVSLFDVFPPGDPAVAKARTRLSGLLF